MRRAVPVLATVVVAASVLTGCGVSGSDEGGFGPGTLAQEDARSAFDSAGVAARALQGMLRVRDDGCFTWSGDEGDGAWIVWPDTVESDADDGGRVVLQDGAVVSDGTTLSAEGAVVTLADLPDGGDPDSYFGSYGRFCDADARGVMLLSDVSPG
jgi:hypothetical protein